MSNQARAAWDERFRTGSHAHTEPDPLLLQCSEYSELFPGGTGGARRALDVACGAGRNAVWLAQQGWEVTACDISLEGLRKAQALARSSNVRLDLFCQDLEIEASASPFPRSHFDLIVCFFYLERKLFPWLKAALRPHGLIVYKTYTADQLRFPSRPRHRAHLLERQELLEQFREFRVLLYRETISGRGVAELIAQKK